MIGQLLHITQAQDADNYLKSFQQDVLSGLLKIPKEIPSKYFYDERGSLLFNQITHHPDYYLTRCELEILQAYKTKIAEILNGEAFNLIELGPGEGIKTNILIEEFLKDNLRFRYLPIDISEKFLKAQMGLFNKKFPSVTFTALHSDYLQGLKWAYEESNQRNLVLFLGSSIGNFDSPSAVNFLKQLRESLHQDDYVLIGFDLKKEVDILLRAYNDASGITHEFNLNLLRRINRELSANFNVDAFYHDETYNAVSGAMESYLVSKVRQQVRIDALHKTFVFEALESIHVEYSFKYLVSQIEELAKASGFEIIEHFSDKKNFFVDSLWRAIKT